MKIAILGRVVDVPARGVGDMSGNGWFNLSMAWLISGVPGVLVVLAARSHGHRVGRQTRLWPAVGVMGASCRSWGSDSSSADPLSSMALTI